MKNNTLFIILSIFAGLVFGTCAMYGAFALVFDVTLNFITALLGGAACAAFAAYVIIWLYNPEETKGGNN